MKLTDLAIARPVGTAVASLLLILFGTLGFLELPIREYPEIEEPEVSIEVSYPGASAAVVESRVTQRIEDAVSGIEGLESIESSSEDGEAEVTLTFTSDHDLNIAANDVRDQIGRIADSLPDEAEAPEISKDQGGSDTVMILSLRATSMSPMALSDYADRYLVDRFAVLDGVSRVRLWGAQSPAMRIWLDHEAMTARNVTVDDVTSALESENVEYPGGRIESHTREFTVRLMPGYKRPVDFERLTIRHDQGTQVVRLGDIARVELGPETLRESFEANGEPTVSIAISRQSTANTLAISRAVRAELATLQDELPEGVTMGIVNDDTLYISAAMEEVSITLVIAVVMVVVVIIAFLGSWRSALIPAVTIPISILASGILLAALGFSINLLTLLALVLAVGLVVDDAIVMIENIQRHLDEGDTPLVAAYRGARQVAFAIIATSLVLMAVFLPITLMAGQTGRLFTEFAVTIAAAILFSTFVSLTLTPMMASYLLRTVGNRPQPRQPFIVRLINASEVRYARLLMWGMRRPVMLSGAFIALVVVTCALLRVLPMEYEPYEDRGSIRIRTQAEEGTNFEEMTRRMRAMGKEMAPVLDPAVVSQVLMRLPEPGNDEGAVNYGRWILQFAPWEARDVSTREVANRLRETLVNASGLRISVTLPQGLSSGNSAPVQFALGGPSYETLKEWRDRLMPLWQQYPGLSDLNTDYVETTPQIEVRVDPLRTAQLGVRAETIGAALETFMGGLTTTTFEENGQEYDVIVQGERDQRLSPAAIEALRVRADNGALVRLGNLADIEEVAVSRTLNRYNRLRTVTFSANVTEGYTLPQVLDHMAETVRTELPSSARIDYKGASRDTREASSGLFLVFTIALLVTWLVLAAQFESVISPLVVMLTVPLGVLGASAGLIAFGQSLHIYAQIGMLMLIGLSTKNGILIVEFANQLRDQGMALTDAVLVASRLRLRPILMTSFATMAGALPLIMTSGAGSASRFGLGITIFFGSASAAALTLLVIPLAYQWIAGRQHPPGHRAQRLTRELEDKEQRQ
ncbi:efflux RND transporter permease subunit [Phytohalomonas tamaricis]|uniref:efflux RND transporter permease subunit n=1 Tax=Phytohalomonas tamaricis TaxID=2081032 RepID=UPI000D0BA152|nr:efflux RND transporter permease subunit [Phytohalomonas tamaricis]